MFNFFSATCVSFLRRVPSRYQCCTAWAWRLHPPTAIYNVSELKTQCLKTSSCLGACNTSHINSFRFLSAFYEHMVFSTAYWTEKSFQKLHFCIHDRSIADEIALFWKHLSMIWFCLPTPKGQPEAVPIKGKEELSWNCQCVAADAALPQQRIRNSCPHCPKKRIRASPPPARNSSEMPRTWQSMKCILEWSILSSTPKRLKSSDEPLPSMWHVRWPIFLYVNHFQISVFLPVWFSCVNHLPPDISRPWEADPGERGAKTILPKYNFSPQSRISCP